MGGASAKVEDGTTDSSSPEGRSGRSQYSMGLIFLKSSGETFIATGGVGRRTLRELPSPSGGVGGGGTPIGSGAWREGGGAFTPSSGGPCGVTKCAGGGPGWLPEGKRGTAPGNPGPTSRPGSDCGGPWGGAWASASGRGCGA